MFVLILKFLALAVVSLAGLFVVPIALMFAGEKLPKWAWIWDNDRDGINGDGGFKNEHCPAYKLQYGGFLCRFIWLAIRNPAANLCWYFGVKEPIVEVKPSWYGSVATGQSGKKYILIHFKSAIGEMYFGYKNDNAKVGELIPYNIGVAFRGIFAIVPFAIIAATII